ncbi:cysteine desulfurase family protein [Microbacterium halotolerans]|uniref:cysteine desulfurase family protein n=1 Tax=Microbacterium halotolerans TaxID=246613 RepID=UPI000E6AAD1C|nr:cysteine desulfurase family protein [Microbacterium halotolerans]
MSAPVYLDHAATTPLRPEVRDAWLETQQLVGNASSIHGAGQQARRVLEDARERLAAVLGCEPIEVVLTSGGTESIGLALQGLWRSRATSAERIVLPDGEHHATLDTVGWLASHEGSSVTPVSLDAAGRIPVEAFMAALAEHTGPDVESTMRASATTRRDAAKDAAPASPRGSGQMRSGSARAAVATALVAGNETGTVNDAAGLSRAAADAGVPLHLDAVAAFGHVGVEFSGWRGDASPGTGLVALSVSGHKIGAPVGTGALVVSRTATVEPLLHGGGQQRGLRAGTQDIAGAVALARAAELAELEREAEAMRLGELRERFLSALRRDIPEAVVLGDPEHRLPGTIHLHLPGAGGESLLFLLDQRGISVSTGSACQAGVAEPSHVVMALGYSQTEASQVLRISLGRTTTAEDVDALAGALPVSYRRLAAR